MASAKTVKHPRNRTAGGRSGNPAKAPEVVVPPATFGDWVGAARLRTLPLAASPVIIGTGAAQLVDQKLHWLLALGCLAVAVFLQIGVNYANDYSDGVRGTDAYRVGPARLTGAGRANPRTVLTVALVFFGLAALSGLALVIRTQQWWLIAVGAVCILAAWFYTGGKRPYGYAALGEVFVFVFFGLVATLGTTWIQVQFLPQEAWFGAVAAGFFAVCVLLANNLRDIEPDKKARKRTLSVIIGRRGTQVLYTVLLVLAMLIGAYIAFVGYTIAWLTLMTLLLFIPAGLVVWMYRQPRELVVALSLTSFGSLAWALIYYWAVAG